MSNWLPTLLRWAARGTALLLTGIFLLILSGEIATPHAGARATPLEYLGMLFILLAVMGMMLAWREELAGAILSLAAILAFGLTIDWIGALVVAMIPGVLYLADWGVRHPDVWHRVHLRHH
ncbi:MAG: hypothetical protein JNK87_18700 [Bryobacterales bacterium]|nr:hypothetical protein [Bryobacterales bacterium]